MPSLAVLLLAMLIFRRGEAVSRDEIAFTLWPDLNEPDARTALRRHLYTLEQSLSPSTSFIVRDAKSLKWEASNPTWVDVTEFERLSESSETQKRAMLLYAGDFVPFIDHEWATGVREKLRRRACRTLEQLVRRCVATGDAEEGLCFVEQLLALDPWKEEALRQLLILRYQLGDRAGALAYYRGFCERLRSEFGVEPMPATVRVREDIARGLPVDPMVGLHA